MPALVCPRCQRTNPADAVYCHHDGNLLRMEGVKGTPTTGLLNKEFTFPSKRRCATLDDFVQGCQYEWEEARDLLKRGEFSRYFAGIGRKDLARAAKESEQHADPDVGLHNFLGVLPASESKGPKIDIHPRRIVLNKVKPGEVKQVVLKVSNQGKGLLQGKLTVSEGNHWFRLAFGGDSGKCAIKTAQEDEIVFVVDTRTLAAPASYNARLTIITNGGIHEVPIRLDLGATAFALPPFKGASSPRDMAERMRANPKGAVPLLENGEIQNWFVANGWAFPSLGIPAPGIAAVQQFFEGMGLSKPPQLYVSESEVHCFCVPPEVLPKQVVLYTQSKKWVYGQADCEAYWLKLTAAVFSGPQQAAIGFEIDSSLMEEGQVHETYIHITANMGQQMSVRVVVDVHRPPKTLAKRLFGPFIRMLLLAFLYRLLFVPPGDIFARLLAARATAPAPGAMARWTVPAASEEGFLRLFVAATFWIGAAAGIAALWKRRGHWSDPVMGGAAGIMFGVIAAVTAACAVTSIDSVPRLAVSGLAESGMGAGAAAMLWLVLVLLWWCVLGAAAGSILPALGRRGKRAMALAAWPIVSLLTVLRMKAAAAYFAGTAPSGPRDAAPAPAALLWTGPVIAVEGVTRKG